MITRAKTYTGTCSEVDNSNYLLSYQKIVGSSKYYYIWEDKQNKDYYIKEHNSEI